MMNYYDALLQHRQHVADAERQALNARHLRDSQRTPEEKSESEKSDRPSSLTRIIIDLKAAFTALRPAQKPACPTLVKDIR